MQKEPKNPEQPKGFYLRNLEEGQKSSSAARKSARKKGRPRRDRSSPETSKSVSRFVDEENSNLSGLEAQGQGKNEEFSQSQRKKKEDVFPDEIFSPSKTMGKEPLPQDDSGLIENIDSKDLETADEKSTLEEIESQGGKDDQELEAEIEEAIEKEDSISASAKNIQVTVENGKATLVGTVVSEQEKMTIGDKAAAFVGFGKVINELEIVENVQ